MRIVVAQDRNQLGHFVAEQASQCLRACLASQPRCNLVIATGSSQFEVLDRLVQQSSIDWARVDGFHLDEYLGVDRQHSASFVGYLASRFVNKLPLGSFYFLDGMQPPDQLKRDASAAISGRQIDLLLCGIGENGHLAFNDPPADFDTTDPYLIVELDDACRKQQVGEGWFDRLEHVPERAISMSIQQILRARQILCTVPDRRKAQAVQKSVEGPIVPEVPASILQQHAAVTLILDRSSADLLSAETLSNCELLEVCGN